MMVRRTTCAGLSFANGSSRGGGGSAGSGRSVPNPMSGFAGPAARRIAGAGAPTFVSMLGSRRPVPHHGQVSAPAESCPAHDGQVEGVSAIHEKDTPSEGWRLKKPNDSNLLALARIFRRAGSANPLVGQRQPVHRIGTRLGLAHWGAFTGPG